MKSNVFLSLIDQKIESRRSFIKSQFSKPSIYVLCCSRVHL